MIDIDDLEEGCFGIGSERWRSGRAPPYYSRVPADKACEHCGGCGESQWRHRFLGGYSYVACFHCDGSGKKEETSDMHYKQTVHVVLGDIKPGEAPVEAENVLDTTENTSDQKDIVRKETSNPQSSTS